MLSFCKVKPQLLVPQAFIQHLLRNAEFHEWKRNEIRQFMFFSNWHLFARIKILYQQLLCKITSFGHL